MTSRRQFILIFAHPRSGSTTLAQVLSLHPDIRIIEEPFAERKVQTLAELDQVLEALVEAPWLATGIKHVYNYSWPFLTEQAELLNRHLLLREGWMPVLLWRRNLFDAALSNAIAMQLSAWDTETSRRLLRGEQSLDPVPVEQIHEHVGAMERDIARYRSCLDTSAKPFLELTYEELYGDHVPSDEKVAAVNALIRAAGYDEVTNTETMEAMKRMLAPDNKLNNRATYQLIPNFEELSLALSTYANALSRWRQQRRDGGEES